MKIGIIGASASGIYSAIFVKRAHPEYDVTLIDKNDKIGKKIYATGNGRCNLLNISTSPSDYNYPLYMEPLLKKFSYEELKNRLNSIGVEVSAEGYYVYPASFSAASFVSYLSDLMVSLGIKTKLGAEVGEYRHNGKGWNLIFKNQEPEEFDELVFCTGGMSHPDLGSDGSLFPLFFQHGYEITPLNPSLCPIKTIESTKTLLGLRHHALATVFVDGRILHQEEGEVLFKKDGLSGIVIFNCESFIAHLEGNHQVSISLDLFPEIHQSTLTSRLVFDSQVSSSFLSSFLQKPLADYVLKSAGLEKKKSFEKADLFQLAKAMKNLEFTFKEAYGFADSTVTAGGIKLNFVDENLASCLEKGIFFAGELLDVDGLCGGHNLTWALISALLVSGSL